MSLNQQTPAHDPDGEGEEVVVVVTAPAVVAVEEDLVDG